MQGNEIGTYENYKCCECEGKNEFAGVDYVGDGYWDVGFWR